MDVRDLQQVVRELHVGFHVRPELAPIDDALARVGWVVELTATHGIAQEHPIPGCPQCQPVARALQELAEHVAGDVRDMQDMQDVRCEVHVDPARHDLEGSEALMTATLTILPVDAPARVSGERERRVTDEVVSSLRRLGAQPR